MRLLLTVSVLAMALAGCVTPEQPDPLFGVCPQWLDATTVPGTLAVGGARTFEADHTNTQGQSLDLWTVAVDAAGLTGVAELRAKADDGRPLRFTDYRDPAAPRTPTFMALNAGSGEFAVDVFLTDVTHGTEAAPSGITLTLTAQDDASGRLALKLTPAYRVCGAPLPAAE